MSAVIAFVAAMGVERFIIRPIGHESPFAVVVAAIGLFLGLNALAPFIWKVTIPEAFGSLFPNDADDFVRIGGAEWRYENIGVLVVLAVTSLLLFVLFQRTKLRAGHAGRGHQPGLVAAGRHPHRAGAGGLLGPGGGRRRHRRCDGGVAAAATSTPR